MTEPINEEKLPELNMKNIISREEDLRKEFFRLLATIDIGEAESSLEDVETRLEKKRCKIEKILA